MFTRPLPQHIIGAMTTLFDLDNDTAEVVNTVLTEHAGESADGILMDCGATEP